jgi:hypothetical protein
LKLIYGFSLTDYVAALAAFSYLDRIITLALVLVTVLLAEPRLTVFGCPNY